MRMTTAAAVVLFACATLFAQATRFEVLEKTIPELQNAMQAGEVTSRQLVSLYVARIGAYDRTGPHLNAIVIVNPNALRDAEALDRERAARGPRGPLHGIPIVVKDNFETVDMPTAAGSLALAGYQSKTDAFQVRRLRDAGAVLIGKNQHARARVRPHHHQLGSRTDAQPVRPIAGAWRIERGHRRGSRRKLRGRGHGQR